MNRREFFQVVTAALAGPHVGVAKDPVKVPVDDGAWFSPYLYCLQANSGPLVIGRKFIVHTLGMMGADGESRACLMVDGREVFNGSIWLSGSDLMPYALMAPLVLKPDTKLEVLSHDDSLGLVLSGVQQFSADELPIVYAEFVDDGDDWDGPDD